MKYLIISICVFTSALVFTSCSTTKSTSYDYDYLMITKQGVIQRPLMADLDVRQEKITVSKTFRNTTLAVAKQNIVKDFIKTASCDLVVQPSWDTEADAGMGKSNIDISLTGFPASYKNFRNYEPKDSSLLISRNFVLGPDMPVPTQTSSIKKKGKGIGKILTVLGLVGLAYAVSTAGIL